MRRDGTTNSRPPSISRRVAKYPPRLFNRKQRFELAQSGIDRNAWKSRCHQLAARGLHQRIGCGNRKDVNAGYVSLKPQPAGLSDIPAIDPAPQVPFSLGRVGPERGDLFVVFFFEDIGDAQTYE